MTLTLWFLLAGALVVVGIVGTLLPALPGLPLVFAGLLVAAWADGFAHISVWTLVLLGVITGLAMLADFAAGLLGTRVAGASKWAMLGAAIGTIAGLFFGPIGLLLGPFVGAVVGELIYQENLKQAAKAGLGAWLGLLLGAVAKMAALGTMLGWFALAWLI